MIQGMPVVALWTRMEINIAAQILTHAQMVVLLNEEILSSLCPLCTRGLPLNSASFWRLVLCLDRYLAAIFSISSDTYLLNLRIKSGSNRKCRAQIPQKNSLIGISFTVTVSPSVYLISREIIALKRKPLSRLLQCGQDLAHNPEKFEWYPFRSWFVVIIQIASLFWGWLRPPP